MAQRSHFADFCDSRVDLTIKFKLYLERECPNREAAMKQVLATSLMLRDMTILHFDHPQPSAEIISLVRP